MGGMVPEAAASMILCRRVRPHAWVGVTSRNAKTTLTLTAGGVAGRHRLQARLPERCADCRLRSCGARVKLPAVSPLAQPAACPATPLPPGGPPHLCTGLWHAGARQRSGIHTPQSCCGCTILTAPGTGNCLRCGLPPAQQGCTPKSRLLHPVLAVSAH